MVYLAAYLLGLRKNVRKIINIGISEATPAQRYIPCEVLVAFIIHVYLHLTTQSLRRESLAVVLVDVGDDARQRSGIGQRGAETLLELPVALLLRPYPVVNPLAGQSTVAVHR